MICEPCRMAGDLNSVGLDNTAAKQHEECVGGTRCDCQHKIGKWVDRSAGTANDRTDR